MAKFSNEELGCSFEVADEPTVAQVLDYFGRIGDSTAHTLYMRLWYAARPLIDNWECEQFPDPMEDLDAISDLSSVDPIMWASDKVLSYMKDLRQVPKN